MDSQSSEEEATYFALSAKFMAESCDVVGKNTYACVREPDSPRRYITYAEENKVRELWESNGAPRVPQNLKAVMAALKAKNLDHLIADSANA